MNLDEVAFDDVEENGPYTSSRGSIGRHIGARQLGYNLTVMVALFRALCARSESMGFSRDDLGLDPGFEPERKRCLDVVARNQVAAGIIVPRQIISRPFAPPKKDARFTLDDGIILL